MKPITTLLITVLMLLLSNICSAQGQTPEIIEKITPATAAAGANQLELTITFFDLGTPPVPPSEVIPTSITIGNIEASNISRDELIISAVISIPENETNGLKDVTISFPGPDNTPIQFTKYAAFEVTGGKDKEEPTIGKGEGGETLFAPIGSTSTYLVDENGEIVRTWTSTKRPALSCYLLQDKSLLRTATQGNNPLFANAAGNGGIIERYDWNNNKIWEFSLDNDNYMLHHDIEYLPNGNILAIAYEYITDEEALAAGRNPELLSNEGLWPDMILEIEPTYPTGGTIVWQWRVMDHIIQDMDASKPNYGSISEHPQKINLNYSSLKKGGDWNHLNAIDYNAELDQIMVTSRNFSEIWIINHNIIIEEAASEKGDLLYRWGNPAAYDRGTQANQKLYGPHDGRWIENNYPGDGDITIFNNGQNRPEGKYSTVDQITPPLLEDGSYKLIEEEAYAPEALTWTYIAENPTDFYGDHISGADRLKGGNTIICEGTTGRIFEVEENGTLVWEYHNPIYQVSANGDTNKSVFRATRYDISSMNPNNPSLDLPYPIVETGQEKFYNSKGAEISAPTKGDNFYGQDAQYEGHQPSYTNNEDGTVTDNVTGLMWSRSSDLNGDGVINVEDKLTQAYAETNASEFNLAGYTDWRLPTIKELYSLIMFYGEDPSGYTGTNTETLVPFINTDFFEIGYGDTDAGERIIDAQFATKTIYVSTTMNNARTMFGVNFADGRIKGYPTDAVQSGSEGKLFYVHYVRGNPDYGKNDFVDNSDGTITDKATGLMWSQDDSKTGLNWEEALAWVKQRNEESFSGYSDWRLPNVKELQSIIDYTRSPATSGTAAIDPLFICSEIKDEAGETNFPFYWSGTTHANMQNGANGSYVAFGEGLGFMSNPQGTSTTLMDVHGAGCQRSDPKEGNPDDYPTGHGPQGDVIRIYNYVRLVRDAEPDVSIHENGNNYYGFELNQNYPNPFNNNTAISFTLSSSGNVTLTVCDELGQKVSVLVNGNITAGNHTYSFDSEGLTSGIYYYTLVTEQGTITKAMSFVK